MTFTLDDGADHPHARRAPGGPESVVVREAVAAFAKQEQKLEAERARRLCVLDEPAAKPRTRPQSEVDEELRTIRLGRRTGWRRRLD